MAVSDQLPVYLEHLWRFAYRLSQSQDAAKELTQNTCLRALEYQSAYSDGNMKSWLFKIMHNLWRDELRYNMRAGLKLVGSDTHEIEVVSVENPEQQLLLGEVQRMINQLPEAQRTVLLLTAVEGFTYQETAEILAIPLGTVMSRLARAREKMGQLVRQESIASEHSQAEEASCKK